MPSCSCGSMQAIRAAEWGHSVPAASCAVLPVPSTSKPPSELTLWPAGGCAGMQGAICMAVLKVMVPARGRVGQLLVGSVVFAELL